MNTLNLKVIQGEALAQVGYLEDLRAIQHTKEQVAESYRRAVKELGSHGVECFCVDCLGRGGSK